jgi:hypothetical protein
MCRFAIDSILFAVLVLEAVAVIGGGVMWWRTFG